MWYTILNFELHEGEESYVSPSKVIIVAKDCSSADGGRTAIFAKRRHFFGRIPMQML